VAVLLVEKSSKSMMRSNFQARIRLSSAIAICIGGSVRNPSAKIRDFYWRFSKGTICRNQFLHAVFVRNGH
jgi:hypothetical protein